MPVLAQQRRFYPTLAGYAPELDQAIRRLYDMFYAIEDRVDTVQSADYITRAEAQSQFGPERIREQVQTSGDAPVNVTNLIGILAQPQFAKVPLYTSLPPAGDPVTVDGALIRIGTTFYYYNETSASWVLLPTGGGGGGTGFAQIVKDPGGGPLIIGAGVPIIASPGVPAEGEILLVWLKQDGTGGREIGLDATFDPATPLDLDPTPNAETKKLFVGVDSLWRHIATGF